MKVNAKLCVLEPLRYGIRFLQGGEIRLKFFRYILRQRNSGNCNIQQEKNTDLFSYLGVFSSGWFANRPEISNSQYEFMKNNTAYINENLKSLWVAMGGKEDIAYNNCKIMLAKFDEMGIRYTYNEYPGGHTWPVWRNNLYNFAQLLFR